MKSSLTKNEKRKTQREEDPTRPKADMKEGRRRGQRWLARRTKKTTNKERLLRSPSPIQLDLVKRNIGSEGRFGVKEKEMLVIPRKD